VQLESPPIATIPYTLYSDPEIYAREQERIFRGHAWNYVGLEAEIPNPGDFKRTWLGDRPIVVVRGRDGKVNVVENVCAHRGVSFCFQEYGNTKVFQCPYHQWSYDLTGKLIGVPVRKGIGGQGGLAADFDMSDHGLTALQVASRNGVIYASYDATMESLEDYFNDNLYYIDRMFDGRELRVLGYWRQKISCNWKLMVENLRDPYHATLLHVFLVAFSLNRADQPSSARLDRDGKHGAFTSRRGGDIDAEATKEIQAASKGFDLQGKQLLHPVKEFADADTLVMQSVWPNIILQQQLNALAIRQLVPRGPSAFELHWTCIGYADDDAEMIARRRMQANLVGPAGFVSVDDSEVIEMIQRGVTAYNEAAGVVPMGGTGTESCDYTVTEAPLRAFHAYYRKVMGL
jgi:salicylate 5-hydroxylase large subunit